MGVRRRLNEKSERMVCSIKKKRFALLCGLGTKGRGWLMEERGTATLCSHARLLQGFYHTVFYFVPVPEGEGHPTSLHPYIPMQREPARTLYN